MPGAAGSPLFLDILRDPQHWGVRTEPLWGGLPDPAGPESARRLCRLLDQPGRMTHSQRSIYKRLVEEARLQIVWGPPGAGKTYCLASLICRFALRAKFVGYTMRVLVTAVTHEAIDNLLLKVKALMAKVDAPCRTEPIKFAARGDVKVGSVVDTTPRDGSLRRKGLRVVKLLPAAGQVEVVDDSAPANPFVLAKKDVKLALDLEHIDPYVAAGDKGAAVRGPLLSSVAIVGCTTQQMPKLEAALIKGNAGRDGSDVSEADPSYFDAVVLDEASQMLLAQLSMPVHLLRRDGMLILAGDHKQMPPILQNAWPEVALGGPGSPPVHLSSLQWLRERASAAPTLFSQLKENHRMTKHLATICRNVLGYDGYDECHKPAGASLAPACSCKLWGGGSEAGVPPLTLRTRDNILASLPDGTTLPRVVLDALCDEAAFVLVELKPEAAATGEGEGGEALTSPAEELERALEQVKTPRDRPRDRPRDLQVISTWPSRGRHVAAARLMTAP